MQVSRFGVIPKGGRPGEWRLIHDLSSPPSVNNSTDPRMCSVQYPTVDQAVARVLNLQPGALLAKPDVAHAFQNIPVYPEDHHLLGMRWGHKIFLDLALPFGLWSSPRIITLVTLEWVLRRKGVS